MKRIGSISAHALVCDGCGETFYSYSTHTIIRRQAKAAGWARVSRAGAIRRGIEAERIAGKRADLCPAHQVKP